MNKIYVVKYVLDDNLSGQGFSEDQSYFSTYEEAFYYFNVVVKDIFSDPCSSESEEPMGVLTISEIFLDKKSKNNELETVDVFLKSI